MQIERETDLIIAVLERWKIDLAGDNKRRRNRAVSDYKEAQEYPDEVPVLQLCSIMTGTKPATVFNNLKPQLSAAMGQAT